MQVLKPVCIALAVAFLIAAPARTTNARKAVALPSKTLPKDYPEPALDSEGVVARIERMVNYTHYLFPLQSQPDDEEQSYLQNSQLELL